MRKWKDESLITAGELRRQMKRMGLGMEEEQLHDKQAANAVFLPLPLTPHTEEHLVDTTTTAVDPCDVPLPETSRTERMQGQQDTETIAQQVSADPCDVPLPESARTARTGPQSEQVEQ
jgi:hypothetical protein